MNKTAIKTFAIEARKKLIASVKDKAGLLAITIEGCSKPEQKGAGFEIYRTHAGTENKIFEQEIKQRQSLVNRIKEKGYDHVIEEVAYTWFNRIIAIRFMEVNDYLPTRVRVLSSETEHKIEPDIVTQAPDIDLDFTESEKEKIYILKSENKLDELFSKLFIKQCNKLGEILPDLFEKVSDYTELLLNISYTNQDGVICMLIDNIEESDFEEAIEIIGWLYQYYNTELKDDTFALLKKNVKITKERIPSATQLFTPDWIVRYMVENSLGRLWLEHLGAENKEENNDKIDSMKLNWRYYLDEAEQEENVQLQLNQLRESYKELNPEDIKIIDPCMGSGHILVYAFDIFMKIYKVCGYSEQDAAKLIIQKNLYGIEIDDRSYQLAYFAVMMKGREYDRRFLTREIKPNLCSIQESNTLEVFEQGAGQLKLNDLYKETANYLISEFKDAKEYGSVLNIEQRDYDGLLAYIEELKQNGAEDLFIAIWLNNISELLPVLIKQAKILGQKYDVVITNPPYMGSGGMNVTLSDYVKKNYPDSKSDLFAVFIERCGTMLKKNGLQAMITQHAWMFLSSYEKLREKLLHKDIVNMAHLGARAFEEIGGEVVQTTAFVMQNRNINNYKSTFNRLIDFKNQKAKEQAFLSGQYKYAMQKESFAKIPGMPLAYWIVRPEIFKDKQIGDFFFSGGRNKTHNDEKYLRYHWETERNPKWVLYAKGGDYRKWYGNELYIVSWSEESRAEYSSHGGLCNTKFWGKEGITWALTSTTNSFRVKNKELMYSSASPTIFNENYTIDYKALALLNSCVTGYLLKILNPTLSTTLNDVCKLPYNPKLIKQDINNLVEENIVISKTDWDSYEISWNFKKHPFLTYRPMESSSMRAYCQDYNGNMKDIELVLDKNKIGSCFTAWNMKTTSNFEKLKSNEEELNRIFIDIYELQGELKPEVEDKDVTIHNADIGRDIRSFVSYAIGCMFGRYSLDVEGLVYAGGSWEDTTNNGKYKTFIPDRDNVLPITDEEYFEDDIVGLFVNFVKTVYGEETLEWNLDFIAQALGNKGVSTREIIRNYFVKDFYKDHLKVYQKRPIYWQFDSGKDNGFKALIYMHRYDKDTVGRVRADYLHKTQTAIESAIKSADYVIETSSNGVEKAKATKTREKYIKQLAETRIFDEAMAHITHQRIEIDLDDGVKVNYEKLQGVEVSSEGKKTQKIDLLTKI